MEILRLFILYIFMCIQTSLEYKMDSVKCHTPRSCAESQALPEEAQSYVRMRPYPLPPGRNSEKPQVLSGWVGAIPRAHFKTGLIKKHNFWGNMTKYSWIRHQSYEFNKVETSWLSQQRPRHQLSRSTGHSLASAALSLGNFQREKMLGNWRIFGYVCLFPQK